MKNKFYLFVCVFIAACSYFIYINISFVAEKKFFKIEQGQNLVSVAHALKKENIIKSEAFFKLLFVLIAGKDKIISFGEYDFQDKDYNIISIVQKISRGKADRPGIQVTIPEGFTNLEIAKRLEIVYGIDSEDFYKYSKEYTGKLFPETYFFEKNTTKYLIVRKMLSEFEKRVGPIKNEDLVLASIIEGEAKHKEDMAIIAGILKERIKIGMPLQVDVAPETYKSRDIPKISINNPGLNAINAIKNLIKTDYLYYITGNDGNMYYAKTFEEHKKNIAKYLKI